MKLNYIYANRNFKEVKFNSGLNLVLAQVSDKLNMNKDSHNLGKSTLISVIDFMLLKSIDKSHIFKKHPNKFEDYIFFLQIELADSSYLTIRRSVVKQSKVSFHFTKLPYQNLSEFQDWEFNNLPLKRSKEFLNEKLNFEILKNWNYRKSLTYFLRSQDDYRDVFQLAKFSSGKDVDWKPFLFDLLSFEGLVLKEKYELEVTKDKQKELINLLKGQSTVDLSEADKLIGAIELIKDDIQELTSKIDSFSFYDSERQLNKELIDDIEDNISRLNSIEYDLTYERSQIEKSLKESVLLEFDKIKILFNEIDIHFESKIEKSYEDLVEFNKQITVERTKYLKSRQHELENEITSTRADIKKYDSQRNDILSILRDKETFLKFKSFQKDLGKKEGEIIRLEEQLKNLDRIQIYKDELENIKGAIDKKIKEIRNLIKGSKNKQYQNIRRNFRNIIKYILNSPSILYITQNSAGNVEYHAEIQQDNEIDITSESKGTSYKKLLCVAFDLAVLMEYSTNRFYQFVYHDGVFEGLDNRKKVNFLLLMRRISSEYNLQYIFTSIEDDLPDLKTVGKENISANEICLTLSDKDDTGTLFEMRF